MLDVGFAVVLLYTIRDLMFVEFLRVTLGFMLVMCEK